MSKQWEYAERVYDVEKNSIIEDMNKLGAEGWELVVTWEERNRQGQRFTGFFKREKV